MLHLVSGNQAVVHPLALLKAAPMAGHHVRVHLHQVEAGEGSPGVIWGSLSSLECHVGVIQVYLNQVEPGIVHHEAQTLPSRCFESQNKGCGANGPVIVHGVTHARVSVCHCWLPTDVVQFHSCVCVYVAKDMVNCFCKIESAPFDTFNQFGHVSGVLVSTQLSQRLRCQMARVLLPAPPIMKFANLTWRGLVSYWEDHLKALLLCQEEEDQWDELK